MIDVVEELVFCFAVVELAQRSARGDVKGAVMAFDVENWIPEFEPGDPYFELSPTEIETALRRCEKEKLVSGYHSEYARSRYRIIKENLEKFYRLNLAEKDTGVHQVALLGPDWLAETLRNLRAGTKASIDNENRKNDTWEPLPIDRQSELYDDAVQKSEAALEQIQANNGYASQQPEERNGIVETIRGTLSAIKSGFPSRRQIIAGLLAPLKFIAKKFADAVMGEAAKQAIAPILKWLASL